ncbi:MAG: hypothetical protein IJV83_04835 [Clostridia bacterium]|nr:hypothetical protein [Clostridia bacterium]
MIPGVLSLAYTLLLPATLFVIGSYAFELCAMIISILKYHVWVKKEETVAVSKGDTV